MVQTLANVKCYVNKIEKKVITNPFSDKCVFESLKILAKENDEKNFKIIADCMIEFVSKSKRVGYGVFKDEAKAFVESLCMISDHGGDKFNYNMIQTYRGIKMKKLQIGKTQKFFQKIYGCCFFKEKRNKN